MSTLPIIDLTGDDDGGDPAKAPAGDGLDPEVPLSTEAGVHRELENQRHVPSSHTTSICALRPTPPLSRRPHTEPTSLETPQGSSSRQGPRPGTAEAWSETVTKRQRVNDSEDSDHSVGSQQSKRTRTNAGASIEDTIDIPDTDVSADAAQLDQQSDPPLYCYFGAIHDTPVRIDRKPRNGVKFDLRLQPGMEEDVEEDVVIFQIDPGSRRARKNEGPIGSVMDSRQKTFLLTLRGCEAQWTVKRENTPGDMVNPGSTTTVTVDIHCPPKWCRGLTTRAKNIPWTPSAAVDHQIAIKAVTDKAAAGSKGAQSVSNNPVKIDAGQVTVIMQRAFDTLLPEASMPETAAPPEVTVPLHSHQKRGLTFMRGKEDGFLPHDASIQEVEGEREKTCFQDVISGDITTVRQPSRSGGVISDDMGMGKTLMVLSFILLMLPQAKAWAVSKAADDASDKLPRTMATLIVAPSSLIDHWKCEIEKGTKLTSDEIYIHRGAQRDLPDLSATKYVIVLVSYNLLLQKTSKDEKLFSHTSWYRVVFDEAHHLKSRKSQRFKAASKIPSQYKWAMTGTPIQNRVNEIQALFEICGVPHLSTPKGFQNYLVEPLKQNTADCGQRVEVIRRTHVLRRRVDTDLFNVTKRDVVVKVELSRDERDLYNQAKERVREQLDGVKSLQFAMTIFHSVRRITSLGTTLRPAEPAHVAEFRALRDGGGGQCKICGDMPSDDYSEDGNLVCRLMPCKHILCAACASTTSDCTCDDGAGNGPGQAVLTEEMRINVSELPVPDAGSMTEKMRCALAEVEDHPDEKVVILASYVDTVKVLSAIFKERGIKHACVHGDVSAGARAAGLRSFKHRDSGYRALIATIGTMGEGHSLSAACRLICMDNDWNPKTMQQAYSRVYRIDQKHAAVTITQLVAKDTVDEKILERSNRKNKFADALVDDGWTPVDMDSKEDLKDIKTWCQN